MRQNKKLIYNNIEYEVVNDTRTIFLLKRIGEDGVPMYFVADHKRCLWTGEYYSASGIRTVQVISCSGENPFEAKFKS